jgi:phosphotriesterase-related protein
MNRRQFLANTLGLMPVAIQQVQGLASSQKTRSSRIIGVRGELTSSDIGIMLPHEHIMSLFGGEITQTANAVYDREELLAAVIPYLKRLRRLGCRTIADCTTAYFGRAPELLREISEATEINILTNTGYYAAVNDRYVPAHAYRDSAEELARIWIKEFQKGIGDSGIRPGFIKIAVDLGPLSQIDAKIVRAAALTHLETGLTIASHTGDSLEAVSDQLKILAEEGVENVAWIWVHAQKVSSPEVLVEYASRGVWIELDGIKAETMERDLRVIVALREAGLLRRVLLSHDGNTFRYGGRPPNQYHELFTHFIPYLEQNNFSEAEIKLMIEQNPADALSVGRKGQSVFPGG